MSIEIREGRVGEEPTLASLFRRMWLDNDVPETEIVEDWEERVVTFARAQREAQGFRFFVAEEHGSVVGSAACQRFAGLYPDLLAPSTRRYGYVWGVYVDPEHRRHGLGELLTARCVEVLREDGCTHALLHAAPMGQAIYERLGFEATNEMRLDLR